VSLCLSIIGHNVPRLSAVADLKYKTVLTDKLH
jgi:hypothetical protein